MVRRCCELLGIWLRKIAGGTGGKKWLGHNRVEFTEDERFPKLNIFILNRINQYITFSIKYWFCVWRTRVLGLIAHKLLLLRMIKWLDGYTYITHKIFTKNISSNIDERWIIQFQTLLPTTTSATLARYKPSSIL